MHNYTIQFYNKILKYIDGLLHISNNKLVYSWVNEMKTIFTIRFQLKLRHGITLLPYLEGIINIKKNVRTIPFMSF